MHGLVERDDVLGTLAEAQSRAAGEGGRTLLVSGEAGIGKTAVLQAHFQAQTGTRVWWGSCDALETPHPLAPLYEIASQAGPQLVQHLAGPRPALFHAVLDALRLAPSVMVIEDAHWADAATLDLVKFLARRIGTTRSLLVVSYRDDEVGASHPLRRLVGELPPQSLTRADLRPLSETAVAQLARAALRSPQGIHPATGGNPFFVTELLRHPADEVPRSVQDLVLARFSRLSAMAQAVVRFVAISPGRMERDLLDSVVAPALADLEECLDSGLLVGGPATVAFRHELARAAVEAATPPPVAQTLHASLLRLLVARPGESPARIAHHAARAHDAEAVRRFAPVAAREAASRGAHREAAAHWRNALGAAGPGDTDRRHWLGCHAVEAQLTDQLESALAARHELGEVLLRAGDEAARARNLSRIALLDVLALRNADADAANREALAILGPLAPGVELCEAYWVEAQLRMLNRDCGSSADWSRKAIALADRLGHRETQAAARGTLGTALLFIDHPQGLVQLQQALDMALAHDLHWVAANSYSNLGSACGELFRLPAAREWLLRTLDFARQHEIDFYFHYATAWLALCDLYQGRWDESGANALSALRDSGPKTTSRVMALVALGRLRTRRGDPQADEALQEALVLAEATGTLQRVAPVRAARAERAWALGRRDLAVAEAGAAMELAARHSHPWFTGELAYWLWRGGAIAAAPDGCARPYALQIAGDWQAAADAWRALGCPYEEARALADGDAAAQQRALEAFERLGARPAADALRQALRKAGVKGVPRGARETTRAQAYALTTREAEVLRLLGAGLRNSQIAQALSRSVRTVDHHVAAVIAKLGVASREEAVSVAQRDGWLPK